MEGASYCRGDYIKLLSVAVPAGTGYRPEPVLASLPVGRLWAARRSYIFTVKGRTCTK